MASPSTTPTTNAVPSKSPVDLIFNTELLDILANSTDLEVQSRLGETLLTWRGVLDRMGDVLQVNPDIYSTTAEGLAATSSGEFFSVPSSEAFLKLYQNDNGAALFLSEYPSSQTLTDLLAQGEASARRISESIGMQGFDGIEWGVFGQNGAPYIYVDPETDSVKGTYSDPIGLPFLGNYAHVEVFDGQMARAIRWDGAALNGTLLTLDPDYNAVWSDEEGNVAFGVRHDGSFDAGSGIRGKSFAYTQGEEGSREVLVAGETFFERIVTPQGSDNWAPQIGGGHVSYLTDADGQPSVRTAKIDLDNPVSPFIERFEYWLSAGQSLDLGGGGEPAITTRPPMSGVIMSPAHGVRMVRPPNAVTASDLAYIKPAATALSESPILMQSLTARRLLIDEPELGIIAATYAMGGQRIAELSKGTVKYQNGLDSIEAVRDILAGYGMPMTVPFISWRQGESDASQDVTFEYYYDALVQLRADYEADLFAITGQTGTLPMVLDQVSGKIHLTERINVTLAQLQVALDYPDLFICAGPKYQFPYVEDGVHVDSEGSAMLGAKFAEASAAARLGERWFPVYATSATRTGTTVTMTFACPNGELTIDDETIPDPGNYGLRWADDGDGNAPEITSVVLVASNTLELELDVEPTGSNGYIGIADFEAVATALPNGAAGGCRSCLRDDSPINDTNGNPIHHWACHQRIAIA